MRARGWMLSGCVFAAAMMAAARPSSAQLPQPASTIVLWPEGVPGGTRNTDPELMADGRVSNVQAPSLMVFPAPKGPGRKAAVIVCPGGAYRRLAIDKEGRAVARWLNGLGISAFVLKYRLREYGHPAPLQDVLRAVRILRHDADRWDVAPDRIGVLGFSAGGHLAASAGTLYDEAAGRTGSALDRVSGRPDFMVLVYPVVTLEGPQASSASRESLLGPSPDPHLVDRLSLHRRVTADTPPTFLVHGGTDTGVPPENSLLFFQALRVAGVPAELHVYEEGPHGLGLGEGFGPISSWPERCAAWLAARGHAVRNP